MGLKTTKRTRETYTYNAANTVSSAAVLISKLPNGWRLVSLEYNGLWTAVVEGPEVEIDNG